MASKLPYNSLPNLGTLQAGDIVPVLRPPFQEGSAFVSDVQKYVRPYDVYTALISQSGTDDPTIIVLENTIGAIEWTRVGVGQYVGTLSSAFISNNTYVMLLNSSSIGEGYLYSADNSDVDTVFVQTYNINTTSNEDSLMNNVSIEIRVYYSEPA